MPRGRSGRYSLYQPGNTAYDKLNNKKIKQTRVGNENNYRNYSLAWLIDDLSCMTRLKYMTSAVIHIYSFKLQSLFSTYDQKYLGHRRDRDTH